MTGPYFRFVDGIPADLPVGVDVPEAVVEAAEAVRTRGGGLQRAAGELRDAREELERAHEADRLAEVEAAAAGKASPKGTIAKAADRVAGAERKVAGHETAVKDAVRSYLATIWEEQARWAAALAEQRDRERVELVELLAEQVGERFDRIAILDETLRNLAALTESGGMVAGWSLATTPENLELRRARREELIERALEPVGSQLGFRVPPEVAECLALICQHLHPPEPPAELVAHAADRPTEAGWRDSVAWMTSR